MKRVTLTELFEGNIKEPPWSNLMITATEGEILEWGINTTGIATEGLFELLIRVFGVMGDWGETKVSLQRGLQTMEYDPMNVENDFPRLTVAVINSWDEEHTAEGAVIHTTSAKLRKLNRLKVFIRYLNATTKPVE